MRTTPVLGAILCVTLAAGCTAGPQRVGGDAAPAGASSSAPAPSSTPTTAPSTTPSATATTAEPPPPSRSSAPASTTAKPAPTPSETPAPSVLGPNGLGALRLGMTVEQAEATGLIVAFPGGTGSGCTQTHLRAGPEANVYYTKSLGIEIIDAYAGIRTPEGIRIGSSLAAVRAAYPDWYSVDAGSDAEKYSNGRGYAKVPGNGKAYYRIFIRDLKVQELTLQHRSQNCYE